MRGAPGDLGLKKSLIALPLVALSAWAVPHTTAKETEPGSHADAADDSASVRTPLRAYYTAPPVIPHPVTSSNNNECKVCHAKSMTIAGRTTIPTPHLEMSNCQQCHVGTQQFNQNYEYAALINSWTGTKEPRKGTRAYEGAPPTIPHRMFLRDNCTGCHQPNHPNPAVRFDHPLRTNCQQCHVADMDGEF